MQRPAIMMAYNYNTSIVLHDSIVQGATEATNEAVKQLLDYLATNPDDADDGILCRASKMVLAAHSDTGFHTKTRFVRN